MKKIILLSIFCLVIFCSVFAKTDNSSNGESASVVETYQKRCPFNAADFGSTEAMVTALIPPSSPLVIKLEIDWTYEALKERLDDVWFNHIDEALSGLAEAKGFYNCAKACYNLGVPMVMEYYSTIDRKSLLTPISVDNLNRLFNNKTKK